MKEFYLGITKIKYNKKNLKIVFISSTALDYNDTFILGNGKACFYITNITLIGNIFKYTAVHAVRNPLSTAAVKRIYESYHNKLIIANEKEK